MAQPLVLFRPMRDSLISKLSCSLLTFIALVSEFYLQSNPPARREQQTAYLWIATPVARYVASAPECSVGRTVGLLRCSLILYAFKDEGWCHSIRAS